MMNRKSVAVGSVVLLIGTLSVAIYIILNWSWIQGKIAYLSLIPAKEHYTELYFANYDTLSKVDGVIRKGDPISFSFVIHNAEGKVMNYPYVIYWRSSSGDEKVIQKDTVSIENNGHKTTDITYKSLDTYDNTIERSKIYVELPDINQEIHFSVGTN